MNDQRTTSTAAADCPKRIWVMMAFSDDEVDVSVAELAPGLRLHLAKCASCRALSDRLSRTNESLASLAMKEPSAGFGDLARDRVMSLARRASQGTHHRESNFDLFLAEPEDGDNEAWMPRRRPFAPFAAWLPILQSGSGARNAIAAALLLGVVGVWSWSRHSSDSSRGYSSSAASPVGAWIVDRNQVSDYKNPSASTHNPGTATDLSYEPGLVGEVDTEPHEFMDGVLAGGDGNQVHPEAARPRPSRIRRALEPTTFEGAPGAWISQSASPRPPKKPSKLDISRSEQSTEERAADR